MKNLAYKFIGLSILLILLNSCATPVGQSYNTNQKYVAVTSMTPDGFADNFMTGYTLGLYSPKHYDFYAYADNKSDAISESQKKCRNFASSKGWTQKVTCKLWIAKLNTSTGYSSVNNSSYSSSSNSYNQSTPKLFYDSSTGGMKECSYVPTNGKCNSFKIYNSRAYNKNSLFYDSSTDSMRPCIGTVTMTGRCTMFGLYKSSLSSKNQLFYDSDNNRMTTCRHVSVTGKCLAKDLTPRSGSTGGTYIVDDPSNPYYKKVPRSSQDLIKLGNDMIMGNCTLGLNC